MYFLLWFYFWKFENVQVIVEVQNQILKPDPWNVLNLIEWILKKNPAGTFGITDDGGHCRRRHYTKCMSYS